MSFSQFVTDRLLPVVTAITFLSCVYFAVLLATKGSVGGAISTGVLAAFIGIMVLHDVRRLLLKK
jgi:hypothetical protein